MDRTLQERTCGGMSFLPFLGMTNFQIPETAIKLKSSQIRILLWESQLTSSTIVYERLKCYAIGYRQLQSNEQDEPVVEFKFASFDWTRSIQKILEQHYITVIEN